MGALVLWPPWAAVQDVLLQTFGGLMLSSEIDMLSNGFRGPRAIGLGAGVGGPGCYGSGVCRSSTGLIVPHPACSDAPSVLPQPEAVDHPHREAEEREGAVEGEDEDDGMRLLMVSDSREAEESEGAVEGEDEDGGLRIFVVARRDAGHTLHAAGVP